jgi:pimeloyl-ACP methyl ester carboxylesterase
MENGGSLMKRIPVFKDGFVKAGGYKLHYLEWGDKGPNIILLHGSAPYCSAHDLEAIGDALSDKHHILAFDLIGHAQSDDLKGILGFKEHVTILRQAAKAKGIAKATLVGWSHGGWLSMVWASLHPDEVERVILVDIMPVTYAEPTPQDPENTPESFSSEAEAIEFYLNSFTPLTDKPPRGYVEESVRRSRRDRDGRVYPLSHHTRRLNLRKDLDLWRLYSRIRVPLLLIWGSAGLILLEAVERMKAENDNLRVVEVQGANHFVPVSHLKETVSAVKLFLQVE